MLRLVGKEFADRLRIRANPGAVHREDIALSLIVVELREIRRTLARMTKGLPATEAGREPPALGGAGAVSFDEAVARWREHMEAGKRDGKYIGQQVRAVRLLFAYARGGHLDTITPAIVTAYRDSLALAESSPSKINNQLAAFRQFFRWAIRFELVTRNPAKEVENVTRHDGDGNRELTPAEAVRLINAARADEAKPKPQHACIRSTTYIVAWNTGLRRKELKRLRVGDLRGMGTADPYIELHWTAAKNRRATQIPLNAEAHAELMRFYDRLDKRDPLFPTRHTPGFPQLPHDRVVDRDIKAAGIAKVDEWGAPVGMHSLRKGGATALAAAGAPESQVAQFLRHSDPRLTRRVYIRLRRGHLGEVASAIPPIGENLHPDTKNKQPDSCTGAESGDTQSVTRSETSMPISNAQLIEPRPAAEMRGCVTTPGMTSGRGSMPCASISPSGLRGLPTSAIAGAGFEPATACAGAGSQIIVNLTISPAAAGAFIDALVSALAGRPEHDRVNKAV